MVDEKVLYKPPTTPTLVEVPAFTFLMIDGAGDPNGSGEYEAAVSALFAASYPVVMTLKKRGRHDLKVRPLEGLWWADDVAVFDPATEDRSAWRWTMLIRQPDDVPDDVYGAALAKAVAKVGSTVGGRLRVEPFAEGMSAQVMHLGPYADEGPTIARLHEFVEASGLRLRGKHHEVYLSDPRRCAPSAMRTILRHPVAS